MTQPRLTCSIRFVWISAGEGSDEGWLLAHRDVSATADGGDSDEADGRVAEVWVSPLTSRAALSGAPPPLWTAAWDDLILGRRLDTIAAGVPLTHPAPAVAARLRRYLAGGGRVHALLGLDAALHRTGGQLAVRHADLHLASSDLVARHLRQAFETVAAPVPITVAAPVPTTVAAPVSTADRRRLSDDFVRGAVELYDARGVVIGDDNLQIDNYVVRVRPEDVSFDAVLGRPEVVEALTRVRSDPEDRGARAALVRRLSEDYGIWRHAPVTLRVGDAHRRAGLLDGLFAVGVQVGDRNTQRNDFTYVLSTNPRADALLRGNDDLARALADCLCPPPGDSPNLAELDARYRAVVRRLPVDFTDGVQRGVSYGAPGPGEVLRLGPVDGAAVGERNTIEVTQRVEVTRLGFDDLRGRWEAEQVRSEREQRAEAARHEAVREAESARAEAEREAAGRQQVEAEAAPQQAPHEAEAEREAAGGQRGEAEREVARQRLDEAARLREVARLADEREIDPFDLTW